MNEYADMSSTSEIKEAIEQMEQDKELLGNYYYFVKFESALLLN